MKYYITILKRMQIGQDGGIERPWAHLLSQHTKITTIRRTTIDEKDLNQAEKIFHHQRHKEGTTARWAEEANSWYNQSGWATHKLEKNCITEVLPRVSHRPTRWAPLPRSPVPGTRLLEHSALKASRSLNFRSPKGLVEIDISLVKGGHTISQALGPRVKQ